MIIAVPITGCILSQHFGHCEKFAIFLIDESKKTILSISYFDSPSHEPGMLPSWLAGKGVKCVITGGMGSQAIKIFKENDIKVVTGALAGNPINIVEDFLWGQLNAGSNVCDH
ncbi:MAG: ATPase [Spirochaetes bacterium]|jgi:predicted Fe-Mo cluster-binding NifX family protein|nr:ATPase [Spirochaetota bacterium]